MGTPTELAFNGAKPTKMHIDFNSCFASIEQQANPLLRGKPIAVAAYATPSGCILAPSIEAKRYGVKVGMRVREGKDLCPPLLVMTPDPWKYRQVHLKLRRLVSQYTSKFAPKSIDEFILDLEGFPAYRRGMKVVAGEIKQRIKEEIGDWLQVSVGISTNRFLAKTAAGLKKPDGLEQVDISNFEQVYQKLKLMDLCGINTRLQSRLYRAQIYSVTDFAKADLQTLRIAFQSVNSYYWYLRLRGWEIDDFEVTRKSFGNSYALPRPLMGDKELIPIIARLVIKASSRMRRAGFKARGVALGLIYQDSFWHQSRKTAQELFDFRDILREIEKLLVISPTLPVKNISVTCFELSKDNSDQLVLFDDILKRRKLVKSIDRINHRWGEMTIATANTLQSEFKVPDRIGFGGVRELI